MRTCFIFLLWLPGLPVFGQNNWKAMDFPKDSVYGISLAEAETLLKTIKADTITVAVLDDGVDVAHKALKKRIWVNGGDHGRDEDKNGFVNDRYGWNFLGSRDGQNLVNSSSEYQRLYYMNRAGSRNVPHLNEKQWREIIHRVKEDSLDRISLLDKSYTLVKRSDGIVQDLVHKPVYTNADLSDQVQGVDASRIRSYLSPHPDWTNQKLLGFLRANFDSLKSLPISNPFASRQKLVGDNVSKLDDGNYGNANVHVLSVHGTHVAGIIGSESVDSLGVRGICHTVRIMAVRTVPAGGDEFDKDVALAICYAVDNGARVINMSFGKKFSAHPHWVKRALRYAKRKDVLIVKAAGNDGINTDSVPFYPTVYHRHNKRFKNMIVVGASGPTQEKLVAPFSNYGRKSVDVFAPGTGIYSTLPNQEYGMFSGTSMAAPVVTGIAALLRANFPELSAKQVKRIIIKSVQKIDFPVTRPGDTAARNTMSDLCQSGGVANAANAVRLAMSKDTRKVRRMK